MNKADLFNELKKEIILLENWKNKISNQNKIAELKKSIDQRYDELKSFINYQIENDYFTDD